MLTYFQTLQQFSDMCPRLVPGEESVCIRKEFNSHRTGLGHQHGRRFIVLGHQYGRRDVMWKHSISVELPQFQAQEETVKIDGKKRAAAGERGMRVLFSALTCFYDAPIIWQATVDRVLVSWNFVESFQRFDLNEMQIKMT